MFERFVEKSIKSIMKARMESSRLGFRDVGTGQLLVGLMEGDSRIKAILLLYGIDVSAVQIELETLVGRGDDIPSAEAPFSPYARKAVMEESWEFACSCGRNYVLPHDILAAILILHREDEGEKPVAHKILRGLGVEDFDTIVNEIRAEFTKVRRVN
jgi:ATP-dependent Clp protease ATP-binding subunit ClpA